MIPVAAQNGPRIGGGQIYALTSNSPILNLLMLVRRLYCQDQPFPSSIYPCAELSISYGLEDYVGKEMHSQKQIKLTTSYSKN